MKKVIQTIIINILFISTTLSAFEAGQLSLDIPNVLKKDEGSFTIRHRFYGEYSDVEKFLGTDDGGNMHFILKYAIWDNLLIGVDHTKNESAYGLGIEYAYDFDFIKAGVRFNGFSLDRPGLDDRQQSYFVNTSWQTPNYFEHLRLTANVGYDGYYKHSVLGLGTDINVNNFMPYLTFTEEVSLLAEYYPQIDKVDEVSGKNDVYAFGIKFQTFGHHFEILLTNATSMDARSMALGTDSDDLHFGFNINRKF